MSDPFDKVSIYRSTDEQKGDHAQKKLGTQNIGNWCICRFIKGQEPYGWVLKILGGKSDLFEVGFEEESNPWTGSEEVAVSYAESLSEQTKRTNHAVPVERVLWRTMLYSSYDSSRVELYRGHDLSKAYDQMSRARNAVEANNGIYLKAVLEGVIDLKDVPK